MPSPKVNAKGASVVMRERGELRRAIGGGGPVRNKIDYNDLAKQGIPDSWDTWRAMESRSVNIPDRSQMFNRSQRLNTSQVLDIRSSKSIKPGPNFLQQGLMEGINGIRASLYYLGAVTRNTPSGMGNLDESPSFNRWKERSGQ